jgi:hypothetical protein
MTLFAWPSARLEPRDLPVGVAGPARATKPIEQRIAAADGSFDVHRYADEAAARRAIEDRDIHGAVVMTPSGPKALTASAASRTVAQTLTRPANEAVSPTPATAPGAGRRLRPRGQRCRPRCSRSSSPAASPGCSR